MSLSKDFQERARLLEGRLELLEHLLGEDSPELTTEAPIPVLASRDVPPLSFAQQRLWFLDQWEGGTLAYVLAQAFQVSGPLDREALAGSLREIARRHEVLRTRIETLNGEPVVMVTAEWAPKLPLIDLSALSAEAREAVALEHLGTAVRIPFSLSHGSLLRVLLFQLDAERHILFLSMHHIVTDAWSVEVFIRELAELYAALREERPPRLPELGIQYADFAAWQRQWLRGDVLDRSLAYWRDQLAEAPAVLEIPTDRPRPALPSRRAGIRFRLLPSALHTEVAALARESGATLFMTLLASVQVLLARASGQTDLSVGAPVAARTRPELEPLIGFFANMLVLRGRLASNQSFHDLLRQSRKTVSDAFEHQELPFEKLVDELGIERNLSQTPLFQVVLSLTEDLLADLRLPDLLLKRLDVHPGEAKFDLVFSATSEECGLILGIEYRTDLFDAGTIDRLLGHFEALLGGVAADPQMRIWEVPLLGESERRQLLEWSGAGESYPLSGALHVRFAAWVEKSEEAVAVVFEGESLSYGELDRRANQLAHRLLGSGVAPGSRVCLAVERGLGLVEGVLGILKAGCAYVPLDPSYPQDRLGWILEDSRASALVSEVGKLPDLPAWSGPMLLLGEGEGREESPQVAVEPGWPAYVIYTSGSTGRPKGVVVSHGNVLRLMASTQGCFGFNAEDVWALFHSFAFDFSVWELWGALLYGGRLVVVPYFVSRSPEALLELLEQEGVTVLNQTPSAFRALQRAVEERMEVGSESLRWVIFGGEALEPRSLEGWWRRHGASGPGLVNMYGITETTVHSTWHVVTAADVAAAASPIGRPLSDLEVHLLDRHLQLVPVGVPGEVCVAGAGLAQGYVGAPDLTAERFLPNPVARAMGDRLYQSGDLARRRSDGGLEFLGRLDAQVKVRGFRIEPVEIEAALRRHPSVHETAVAAWGGFGEQRLAAYIVTAEGEAPPTPEDLRMFLLAILPAHMVPSAFVPLETLPKTANGKLDRRALPAPGPERPSLATEYIAPRTATEKTLAQVWAQVLGLEWVGVHDNFFVLGGDSILSLRVRALAQEHGVGFSLPQIFAHQTVAELARVIDATKGAGAAMPNPLSPFALISAADRALLSADVEDAYPLTAVQSGMLYHMAYEPAAIVYHNIYSFGLRARFNEGAFREAAREVIERHPILRTSLDLSAGSEPLQLVHRSAAPALSVHDWRALPAEEQDRRLDEYVAAEKLRGFDLSRPPLVRLGLHRRSDESFNFSLTECHPIFDGWSLHSFLSELFEAYFARLDGYQAHGPAPLRQSVADFVAAERAAEASPECRAFWDERLAGCKPALFPWQDRAGQTREEHGAIVSTLRLPDEVTAGLKALARESAVPVKSVLLAAHLEVMSAWSGERDVVTGLLCNGRPEGPDGDRVLGLFFNAVPFRMTLSEGSWRTRVRAVLGAERELLPYRRYPLAQLQKSRGGKPLFDVLFNYIHFHLLRPLLTSGKVELLGDVRRWEETNLPLGVIFVQEPATGVLSLLLRHASGMIGTGTAQRLLSSYEWVLRAMAQPAAAEHAARCRLTEAELHQVVREWNDTGCAAPPRLFLDLFSEQVRRAPEAPAVACDGAQLSYAELDARANRLARWLRLIGVVPEDRVGLCLRRSPDLLAAVLGTLKAGAAYVPLDPLLPAERIAGLAAEARLAAFLTEEELTGVLPVDRPPTLRLDADSAQLAAQSPLDPGWVVPPEAAAYVLFTSGSTGVPKGVLVEHRQLASYLAGILQRLPILPGAAFALVSSFSTDLGNTAIFPCLAMGGCLHVIAEELAVDPVALAGQLAEHPVDILKIVPSHLAALLTGPGPERLLPRVSLILGGEALDPALVGAVEALRSGCAVFNHYGPTETTVGVTTCKAGGAEPEVGETVPLGRPLAGIEILVLDEDLEPVMPQAPGEICIAGSGLARGYLGRPDLTAERFMPHPCPTAAGARIYRSGDRARHLPDGRLEFLGRQDGQVKIRGFRIELREVEVALGRHPAVRECAVVLNRDAGGEGQLVAFCAGTGRVDDAELRSFLRRTLPSYMLPAAFLWLEALPRNASGKIDRRHLPEVGNLSAAWQTRYVAPRSELERQIAAVWQEVLGRPQIGMGDNFFDVGGHSLVLLRLHSVLRKKLQIDLPLMALFEHPTVGSLAEYLSQEGSTSLLSSAALASETQERAKARHAVFEQRRGRRSKEAE